MVWYLSDIRCQFDLNETRVSLFLTLGCNRCVNARRWCCGAHCNTHSHQLGGVCVWCLTNGTTTTPPNGWCRRSVTGNQSARFIRTPRLQSVCGCREFSQAFLVCAIMRSCIKCNNSFVCRFVFDSIDTSPFRSIRLLFTHTNANTHSHISFSVRKCLDGVVRRFLIWNVKYTQRAVDYTCTIVHQRHHHQHDHHTNRIIYVDCVVSNATYFFRVRLLTATTTTSTQRRLN